MPAPPVLQYECLIDLLSASLSRHPYYPVKRFEYGDGFYDQITTGDTEGTIIWTLNLSRASRDTVPPYAGTYRARYYGNNGLDGSTVSSDIPGGYPQSRINYLWYFFKRRMLYGDPFWFVDPTHKTVGSRLGYLASILKADVDFRQDSSDALRYSTSIQIQQARGWITPPGYGKL